MKISYNWLKSYVKDLPEAEKLADIFMHHLCEVESVDKFSNGDTIYDLAILPNRAHDLLCHQGVARELAGQLGLAFKIPEYKNPESKPTKLKLNIETSACKRYMGRIIRNVKIDKSPEWMKNYLESIGQRSINNLVDATNIVMFDCGEPTHMFDLDKINGPLKVRNAKDGEVVKVLDGKEFILNNTDFVVADDKNALIIGGIKGGKSAEVDINTKNIILEVGNFDAVTVRKTSSRIGLRTEGSKRWENGVSPELASYGMTELSALIAEVCPDAVFEDIIDIYPNKQESKKLSFSSDKISKLLGLQVSIPEIKNILERYNFKYQENFGIFEIEVPFMRLDLEMEEDMAEEIGRVLGYDKLEPQIPQINFTPKINDTYNNILEARNHLLSKGYSEVMTYTFTKSGEVEVLASASDKSFLRTNLSDGLKKSYELNKFNLPILGTDEIKIFEIGTVFPKDQEETHVAYADKTGIKEFKLDKFILEKDLQGKVLPSLPSESGRQDTKKQNPSKFKMWSLYPFIIRDIAVWVPEGISAQRLSDLYKENATEILIEEPKLFDQFTKDGRTSYAYHLIFQSYERTLTDDEVNKIMENIAFKISSLGWQVR